ncbi:MAG: hypothetical protein ACXIVQ_06310 [Acidimicrobiales bacterium]
MTDGIANALSSWLHFRDGAPARIIDAVGLVEPALAEGREVTDADLDALRHVCRCGTYPRVRTAIRKAAEVMAALHPMPRDRRDVAGT